MKQDQIEKYRKAAEEGTIPDEENPLFLFSTTANKLLVMGLNKGFDFNVLARRELAERGLNLKGEWIGFQQKEVRKKPQKKRGRRL